MKTTSWFILTALLLTAPCRVPAWAQTPAASAAPAVVSAEPTAFKQVTSKLDPGGSLYAYLSTDQWLATLSAKVRGLRDFVLGLPDVKGPDRAQVEQVFTLIENLVKHSGVESIAGVGLSGIAVEKGLYRTRFVVQRTPGSPEGLLGQAFGAKPHALPGLDWLPQDTVWAVFGDLDANAVWKAVAQEAQDAKIAPLTAGMQQLSGLVQQATARSLEDQLASLGGEVGVVLTLDATRKFSLPTPDGSTLEFPEPSLLIAIKVQDDKLFEWADAAVGQNPQSTKGEAEGIRWRTLPVPVPVPFPLRPTIGRAGDYLWIASSDQAFERVWKTHAGQLPGVKSTAEFQKLAKGLPMEGNSFAFVSQRFGETLVQLQQMAMDQAAKAQSGNAPPVAAIQKLMGFGTGPASFAVSRHSSEGWESVSQGTQEPSLILVAAAVVAPTAILAGMTLPALAKAKSRAQSINCVNNLKQIGLGFRMYANDNDEVLPKDLKALKPYLGTPRVLFCPADEKHPDVNAVTWDNLDPATCSYEFLTPGIKADGPPQTVVARCRVHGAVAHLDGSVQQGTSWGKR